MTEDEVIKDFGLIPKSQELPRIRQLLIDETTRGKQHNGNEALIKLFCIQLFAAANVEDSLLIWRAKQSNFNSGVGNDVQLMCGAGLKMTQDYLRELQSDEASKALGYLNSCEKAGDFRNWSPAAYLDSWRRYYRLSH